MAYFPLQLPPGVVRGTNPDDNPGRWYDVNLVRWRGDVLEPVGGWSKLNSTALSSIPRAIHPWRRNSAELEVLIGCEAHLYSYNDGAFNNVTPSGLVSFQNGGSLGGGYGSGAYGAEAYGTPRTLSSSIPAERHAWSFDNWGEDVVALSSADGRLFYFDSSSPSTAPVPFGQYAISSISRTSNVTTVVTATPHNMTTGESATIAGVTGTGFNTTATITVTNSTTFTYANAGADGSGSGGTVLDNTIPINNRAVIVTPERHVLALQVGGDAFAYGWSSREDYLDWNFASTTNTAGRLPVKCDTPLMSLCAVREGTLMWSEDKTFLIRYVNLPFIYGHDELGTSGIYAPRAFAQFDGRAVWMDDHGFMLYDGGTVRPLPCDLTDYIFSDIDPVFGPRWTHASANGNFNEVWFFYPSNGAEECDRFVIWNWQDNWWSMGSLSRSAMHSSGVTDKPLATDPSGFVYQHEDDWNYTDLTPSQIYAETSVINIGQGDQVMHVKQVVASGRPACLQATDFTIYGRMTPGGAETAYGPYLPRADGYMDTRAQGRDVRVRIRSTTFRDWSIGRLRLDIAAGGKR